MKVGSALIDIENQEIILDGCTDQEFSVSCEDAENIKKIVKSNYVIL